MRKEQIRVLTRNQIGQVTAKQPQEDPRGTGVASVLTSSLYGLESQLDPFSLRVLKRIYDVSMQDRSEKRTRHLRRLRALVPALETLESSPDPFRNIAQEAYKLALDKALLSDDSAKRRSEIVEQLSENLYREVANNDPD